MTGEAATEKAASVVKHRNQKKKLQRKKKKENQKLQRSKENNPEDVVIKKEDQDVEIEYVAADPLEGFDANDEGYEDIKAVIERFQLQANPEEAAPVDAVPEQQLTNANNDEDEDEDSKPSKSNRMKKKEKRFSVAMLKSIVRRPDLVESWDNTAADPTLLLHLKSHRNTVPVPRHWSQKRKYLQGKRGVEKPPFQLPEFIAQTGISKIRAAITDRQDSKNLKAKAKERMQPKLGKLDIDYQVLQDAFFKYQTKPKLTIHGDLYYEGKEYEITLKEKKPGQLSENLKRALGMPEGAPPPWLMAMQRFGPPPSYPNLKIPGLNAPIPEGARYGFHPGGWGKPPVDEFGRPIYGDVFGTAPQAAPEVSQPIERNHWGAFQEEEEEEEEEEQQEEGAEMAEEEQDAGMATPSGLTTPSGMETPESLQIRKAPTKPSKASSSASSVPSDESENTERALYTVLQQTEKQVGNALYGSQHGYIIPVERRENKNKNTVDLVRSQATAPVEVSLTAEEVENLENLSEDVMEQKLDQKLAEKQFVRADVSDLMAEHEEVQKKKRKKDKEKAEKSKKSKGFKF